MKLLFAVAALQAAAGSDVPVPAVPAGSTEIQPAVETAQPTSLKLAALTPIRIKIDRDLESKAATIGEEFDIVLATPIEVAAGYVIPAGTRGRGWVIHASKARMGGKAGELLLGARYLKVGDIEIPLRSLKVGPPQGKDNTGLSAGLTATVGVVGMFVTGGQARVASGMDAIAKTAADVEIPTALLHKTMPVGPAIVATLAPAQPADAAPSPSAQPVKTEDQ